MIYLIDGHNLLHKFKEIKHRIYSDHLYVRDFLITRLLVHFKKNPSYQLFLYFDNKTQFLNLRQKIRGITVIYAKPGKTADDMIKSDVRKMYSINDTIVVVSDDRGITNVVRGGNVFVKSSSEFVKTLKNKRIEGVNTEKDHLTSKLSDSEVENWMNIFGEEDEKEN